MIDHVGQEVQPDAVDALPASDLHERTAVIVGVVDGMPPQQPQSSPNRRRSRRHQPDSMPGQSGTLLSPRVVAEMLGVTTGTLRMWRHLGKDARRPWSRLVEHVKLRNGRVWYYADVVTEFRNENFERGHVDA